MSDQTILIILTVLATALVGLGIYRTYVLAKKAEPKALGAVVLAALHAAEMEVAAKQAAANAATAEAANAAAQLSQIRAQVAGVTHVAPVA